MAKEKNSGSAQAISTQDRSGVYQFVLADGCPAATFPVKIIRKVDPKSGKDRFFNMYFAKHVWVHSIECPKCHHRWEPEQPLRPASVMKNFRDEAKFSKQYADSHRCPKCREAGAKPAPKGHRYRPPNADPVQRKARKLGYLYHDEVMRLVEAIKETEWVPRMQTLERPDGTSVEIEAGWEKKPMVRMIARPDDLPTEIDMSKYLRLIGPISLDNLVLDSTSVGKLEHKAVVLARLNERLKEVRTALNNSEIPDSEKKSLSESEKTLWLEIENLVTQITEA